MKLKLYIFCQKIKKSLLAFVFRRELIRRNDYTIRDARELNLLIKERAYLDDAEVPVLSKYAKLSKENIVEIGCAYGGSSLLILSNIGKGVRLHSIDPFVKDSMGPLHANKKSCVENVKKGLYTLKKNDMLQNWTLYNDFSYDVIKKWKLPIDMIFIDGDHNYQAVKKDFTDWFPFVKKGGYILFHDSRKEENTPEDTHNKGWPGPTKVANELRSEKSVELVDEAYSITVWKKL